MNPEVKTQNVPASNSPVIFSRKTKVLFLIKLFFGELPLFAVYFLWFYLYNNNILPNVANISWSEVSRYVIMVTLILQAITFIGLFLSWYCEHYKVSRDGFVHKTGILVSQEKSYDFDNIDSITINQGILGKIFNYGSLELFEPLHPHNAFIEDIPNPNEIASLIKTSSGFKMKNL